MSLNFNQGIASAYTTPCNFNVSSCTGRYFMGLGDFYFSYEIYAVNKINLYLKKHTYIYKYSTWIPCNTQKKHIRGVRETYLENQYQYKRIRNYYTKVFVDSDLLRQLKFISR